MLHQNFMSFNANCAFGDAVTGAFSQRFIQLHNVLFYSRPGHCWSIKCIKYLMQSL